MAVVWPGMPNGRIALSQMLDVVGNGRESSYLNPAAAYWFKRMQEDCLAETGVRLGVEEAYRSYETQALYNGPNSPLPPGTAVAALGASKHGWGLAVDMTGYNAAWGWLQANAWKYGYDWTEGKNSNERWHWLYIGSLDTSNLDLSRYWGTKKKQPTQEELDEMAANKNAAIIRNYENGEVALIYPGGHWQTLSKTQDIGAITSAFAAVYGLPVQPGAEKYSEADAFNRYGLQLDNKRYAAFKGAYEGNK